MKKKDRRPLSRSRRAAWIRFWITLAFAVGFICFALFANYFAPYDPLKTDYTAMLAAPSAKHLFGTDQLGRDILSRIFYGGRTSLLIAVLVTVIVAAVGIVIGTSAGFFGGFFDSVLMRFCDMLMAFPGSIFTIAMVSFMGTGIRNLILAMSITSWTGFARISRSLVLAIKNNIFVEQARYGGASNAKILFVYIIPNVLPSLLVNIFQSVGGKLLAISGLSLLGLGSAPPTPEWGFMLSEGKNFMYQAPWMLFYPGLIILINVVVFNMLSDSIQELMNPKENVW